MKNHRINGLIAATFTPFDKKGELDLEKIKPYAEHLIKNNVHGVFICGTSGEGLLLTIKERMKVLEAWIPYQDRLAIIVHISATSYKDSCELAVHAEELGVDAIGSMGPCYLPPQHVEELVSIIKIIANSAPNTPYYYYHIPNISGVNIKMNSFLTNASKLIPTLTGIKFTSTDIMDMQECILYENKKFNILNGHDEILLSGLTSGATGSVGTSFNLIPNLYHKMIAAFQSGDFDMARNLQLRSIEFVKLMLKYENSIVSTKAMLKMAGLDLGSCRLPLRNLTKSEYDLLEKELKYFDFFNEIKIC